VRRDSFLGQVLMAVARAPTTGAAISAVTTNSQTRRPASQLLTAIARATPAFTPNSASALATQVSAAQQREQAGGITRVVVNGRDTEDILEFGPRASSSRRSVSYRRALIVAVAAFAVPVIIAALILVKSPVHRGRVPSPITPPGSAHITITVTSPFARMSGDVFVKYRDGKYANAQLSGQIKKAAKGEVARLYIQQFPYTAPPAPAGSVKLHLVGQTATYAFRVTPTLATRYQVKLFRNRTAIDPLANSAVRTIYVIMGEPHGNTPTPTCKDSQCRATETVIVQVPASALSTQMRARPIYTYFAIAYLSSGTEPAAPQTLQLGAGNPVVSAPHQIATDEYQFTLTFSFPSNGQGWHAAWRRCTKSLEAQDGIGLPGPGMNGCGDKHIHDSAVYIG
jgi:hypothetical protein